MEEGKKVSRRITFYPETEQAIKDLQEILESKRGKKPSIISIVNEAIIRMWREERK